MKTLSLVVEVRAEDSTDTAKLRENLQRMIADMPGVCLVGMTAHIPPYPINRWEGSRSPLYVDRSVMSGVRLHRPDLGLTLPDIARVCGDTNVQGTAEYLLRVFNFGRTPTPSPLNIIA